MYSQQILDLRFQDAVSSKDTDNRIADTSSHEDIAARH